MNSSIAPRPGACVGAGLQLATALPKVGSGNAQGKAAADASAGAKKAHIEYCNIVNVS